MITTTTTTTTTVADQPDATLYLSHWYADGAEEQGVPPPPAPPWVYPRPRGQRTHRPAGCRCTKEVFLRDGCNGVRCRRSWACTVPDALTGWAKLVKNYRCLKLDHSLWGLVGQLIQVQKARGRLTD